jgi:hypothetical protein
MKSHATAHATANATAHATAHAATRVGDQCGTDGIIRLARYSVFPRVANGHRVQMGFTRAAGGNRAMSLVAATPEAVGELLRVELQELAPQTSQEAAESAGHDALVRVVSCRPRHRGGFQLEIETLDTHRPRFARDSAQV